MEFRQLLIFKIIVDEWNLGNCTGVFDKHTKIID